MLARPAMQYIVSTNNYITFRLIDPATYEERGDVSSSSVVGTRALPGDIVNVPEDGSPITLVERIRHPPLVGVFDITSKTIYGMSSGGVPQFLFYPLNAAYPPMIVGYSSVRDSNKLVVVRFDRWNDIDKFPRGSLERVIGNAGVYEYELNSLVLSASPWRDVKMTHMPTEARGGSKKYITKENNWRTFNVDPDGCKDIDDLFSYRRVELNRTITSDDIYEVAISIADVAAVVEEGSALDMAACERGETLYVGGVAERPMLPPLLSEHVCSLLVAEEGRSCISLIFELNITSGKIEFLHFEKTHVQNNKTYTYDDVHGKDDDDAAIIKACALAVDGATSPTDSHEWIQTLMVFYNKEVAKLLAKHGRGLLRVHEPSDESAHTNMAPYYDSYPALKYMVMNSAKYEVAAAGASQEHSMFPGAPYCHATSPIRRYADLVNQRHLKAILFSDIGSVSTISLPFIKYHLNRRQKTLRKLGRDIQFLNVLFDGGDEDARIINGLCIGTDATGSKIKVYIPSWEKSITIRDYDGAVVGDQLSISYWFNPTEVRWKDKIVFRVNDLILEPQVQ